jgi:hypothetical protein
MYPTFRFQTPSDIPTFTLMVQNKTNHDIDFQPESIHAYFDERAPARSRSTILPQGFWRERRWALRQAPVRLAHCDWIFPLPPHARLSTLQRRPPAANSSVHKNFQSELRWYAAPCGAVAPQLPLIRLRPRHRQHKGRQFVRIQLTVMIPIRPGELHLEEPKHLIL